MHITAMYCLIDAFNSEIDDLSLFLLFWYYGIAADWFDLENVRMRASKVYNQMIKLSLIRLQ